MTVRWKFEDVYQTGPEPYVWTFDINPSDGGSPTAAKSIVLSQNLGPNRGVILQEGKTGVPTLQFSGTILTQEHYETLESWYTKKVVLRLYDDLGRHFRGIFSAFAPQRVRRPFNPWYHTYSGEFQCMAYANASGVVVYGR